MALTSIAFMSLLFAFDYPGSDPGTRPAKASDPSKETTQQGKQATADELEPASEIAALPPSGSVLVVKAEPVSIQAQYELEQYYVGRIESQRTSRVGFERAGRIAQINVDEGDTVKAGDVLGHLSTDRLEAQQATLRAQLQQSLSDLALAKAKIDLTSISRERQEKLAKRDNVSRQKLDEARFDENAAKAQLGFARASVAQAQASLKEVELEIALSTIVAPFDGSVISRAADEGEAVDSGQQIIGIMESGALEIRAGIPARSAETLTVGNTYRALIDGQAYEAELSAILTEVDAETSTIPALFALKKTGSSVRAGEIARIVIKEAIPAQGFWLPVTGLIEGRRGLWSAYSLAPIAGEADVYEIVRQELKLLHSTSTRAFVTGTVSDGDLLVMTGLHKLVPGQRVRLN